MSDVMQCWLNQEGAGGGPGTKRRDAAQNLIDASLLASQCRSGCVEYSFSGVRHRRCALGVAYDDPYDRRS
jgi:hypothetical protein